jgi:hypothetical protein
MNIDRIVDNVVLNLITRCCETEYYSGRASILSTCRLRFLHLLFCFRKDSHPSLLSLFIMALINSESFTSPVAIGIICVVGH